MGVAVFHEMFILMGKMYTHTRACILKDMYIFVVKKTQKTNFQVLLSIFGAKEAL